MKISKYAFTMVLCAVIASQGEALTQRKNGITWTYVVDDGEACVISVPKTTSGNVVVPTKLGGFPVTGLCGYYYRRGGFSDCKNITSVTINVPCPMCIDRCAFYNCAKLKKIVFKGKAENVCFHNPVFANVPYSCIVYVPTRKGWNKTYTIPGKIEGLRLRYLPTYKVAYYANGGKGKMATQTMKYNKAAKLRKNVFTRKGYKFAGWAKSPKGAIAYTDAQKVKGIGATGYTLKLYARWAKPTYYVSFDANGGKGVMSKQKMTFGKAKRLSTNKFTRPGYRFVGWAKTKGGAPSSRTTRASRTFSWTERPSSSMLYGSQHIRLRMIIYATRPKL